MGKFVFTIKNSDEVIGVSDKPKTIEEAVEFFSEMKNLPINDFLDIYEVKVK